MLLDRFGRDIKQSTDLFSTSSQLRPSDAQGPYTSYFRKYIARKVDMEFYEVLREAIPVIDAAIWKLVSLDGNITIEGNNEKLVDEIQDWIDNVPVNDMQKGLHAFHQNISNEAFEQGFGLGEFIASKKRDDIIRLKVADSKTVQFARKENRIDIYQKTDGDTDYRPLKRENLLYFSINNENQNPYGTSIMRSMEFVAKILATMHNSLLNVWERFGDPSFHISYKTTKRGLGDTSLEDRRKKIAEDFDAAIRKKREGQSMDFVNAVDKDSDIEIKIIGSDGQELSLEIPARHVLEQIISKTGLPSWMLGMHWSTTERLADKEVTMLLQDVATRQAAKKPFLVRLIKILLLLRGRTWKKGDWSLEFVTANLHDTEKQARARFLNLQGDFYIVQNAQAMGTEIDPSMLSTNKGYTIQDTRYRMQDKKKNVIPAKAGIQKHASCIVHHASCKELRRPFDWPDLDRAEQDYETELKYEWKEFETKVFTILKLEPEPNTLILPDRTQTSTTQNVIPAKAGIQKQDIPDAETFTFSEEQRSAIMKALEGYIGIFKPGDPDSAITWYYGLSYSLGLIQAAHMVGAERPILDIIKNKEVLDRLYKEGFKLVKDRATIRIVEKILPEMDAQVIAGTNPVHVGRRLKTLFGAANSDWERLARSELAMAAERAKLDEWKERKIEKVEFVPAPDACPICIGVAGVYNIGEAPVPVEETHPRCRCAIKPA